MRALVSVVTLLVPLIGVPAAAAHAPVNTVADVGPRIRRMLGDEAIDLLVRARRAEIFELEEPDVDQPRPSPKPGSVSVSGYPIVGQGRPVDQLLLADLRAAILDSDNYTFYDLPGNVGIGKLCGGFRPGIAVRFWSERHGRQRHVDALLCFSCDDLALVSDRPGAKAVEHDMQPGASLFLRLAGAAVPENKVLADQLAAGEEDTARALFESMLPARVQTVISPLSNSAPGLSLDAESHRLARSIPGKDLVVLAARAFGVRRADWSSSSVADTLLVNAIQQVPAADVRRGLEAIAPDQVALAGVAELLYRHAFDASLAAPEREALLPRSSEAAVVQMPLADFCPMMTSLAGTTADPGRRLVRRVARGELRTPPPSWMAAYHSPSAQACALLALAEIDSQEATAAARHFAPANAADDAALKGVRLLSGDESALDASLLGVHAPPVADIIVRHLRRRPTRSAIDRIVAIANAGPDPWALQRLEEVMSAIAGEDFRGKGATDLQVSQNITAWWKAHRDAWRPPTPSR